MNISDKVDIGKHLSDFKEFTKDFSPEIKGVAISNSKIIKTAHNSFKRAEPFVMESTRFATEEDDIYHFISYLPINGALYELDGLKAGPILLSKLKTDEDWRTAIMPHVRDRIDSFTKESVYFSMLALTGQKKLVYEKQIANLDTNASTYQADLHRLKALVSQEEEKFTKWKVRRTKQKLQAPQPFLQTCFYNDDLLFCILIFRMIIYDASTITYHF
jgi:ubiquitin carboxyl-terminal hydrolase L5